MNKIYLSPPHVFGNELKYIEQVFESNYIAPVGEFIDRFEKDICDYTKAKYAVAVSSGTAAIHLALRILGVRKGDYVLCSTFTFIGSISPVIYQNAMPIFIDSDLKSWNMDPNLLEDAIKKLKKRPKALILTHLYGQPADMDSITQICEKYDIILIEDAAESLGATYKNKHTGTFGKIGIYSFNGNKIITTSGGGMLVTNDEKIAQKAKFLSTQAKENKLWYEHKEIGYNYRMSNLAAAVGVAQLETIKHRIKRRREIFKLYKSKLEGLIEFMPELRKAKGNRWLTTGIFKDKNPFEMIKFLQKNNIESRPLWKPMHLQPVFRDALAFVNGTSENLFKKGICLPSGSSLKDTEVDLICELIKSA